MELIKRHCVPCAQGTPPLTDEKEDSLIQQIHGWLLLRDGTHKIRKQFKFKNFKKSIAFIIKVSKLAEKEGHHPDMYIFYNKVQLDLFTHATGGLSENDFILAAKINEIKNSEVVK